MTHQWPFTVLVNGVESASFQEYVDASRASLDCLPGFRVFDSAEAISGQSLTCVSYIRWNHDCRRLATYHHARGRLPRFVSYF